MNNLKYGNRNKTINLASTKIIKMKLAELFTITRDPDQSNSWISSQKHILSILTIGGIAVILLWQVLDKYYVEAIDYRLPWLRWITISIFSINLILGLTRNDARAIKQHLVAGFYLGTTFCMLLTMFTGASQSPYWFGLFFIIVSWFVLVPYQFQGNDYSQLCICIDVYSPASMPNRSLGLYITKWAK